MHKIRLHFLFLFIFLVILDQTVKDLAFRGSFGSFLNYLSPVLSKRPFTNYDFAFSLPIPHVVMYSIYILLLGMLIRWFLQEGKHKDVYWYAFVLVLAGALSNIIDRLTLGYVRDFVYVFWGNIFNLADIYIVAGIVLMFKGEKQKT
jgi:signal peptidase II